MASPAERLFAFQWIWEGASQLAEDNYVNTYHFKHVLGPPEDFDNVRDMLRDFYTSQADGQPTALTAFMTTQALSGNWTIKAYNLDDAKPRYPVYTDSGTAQMGSGGGLPSEVALVLSFQAEKIAGEKQSRRRNRVYLGPWDLSSSAYGMASATLVESLLFAARGLFNAAESSQVWSWKVYSPTDDNELPVNDGWVDNAWDTQRRRGLRATARGVFNRDEPV